VAVAPPALTDALHDRFTFERELGRGGMGLVLLCRDLRHHRAVALKVIRPELGSVVGAERFLREIQLAAQLQHPNIVPVYESGECEGTLYYVMPYVEGESLRTRLRREAQLPLEDALEIAREVADALAYAHVHGVVHRDIKPENILLAGGHALVVDFGIARAITGIGTDRLTETGLVIGTPVYMSPEQGSGSQAIDGRTDIYSLACVLYEMLAGEPPYTGPTSQAIIAKRFTEPIPHLRTLREGVPESVEHAVTRALAKSPADRFATAAQFASALASGAVVSPVRLPRWRVRDMRRLFAGLVLLAAAGAGGAVLLRHRPLAAGRVVVAVFANKTGDPSLDPLGDIVADYLARGLAETRLVQVIDARAEQSGDTAVRLRGVAGARALARALGAGSVVWGAYYRQGDSLQFQAQLTDAATGELVGTTLPVLGPARQQTQGVEALRQRVMAIFAAKLDPRLAKYEGGSQPATYEAYREFLAGDEALNNLEAAFAHYRRAYALDSSFTLPITSVAKESWLDGECARTDSIADVLHPRHDRLPVFDRAQLDWAVASCHGQRATALEGARLAMEAAPQSDQIVLAFAWFARHNGLLREAIAATEKLDPARHAHDALYWGNLIIPYHLLGDHRRELEAAQQARRFFPSDLQTLSFEARAFVGLGRLTEGNARLDEMLRVPQESEQVSTLPFWIDQVGRDLRAHGHRPEARIVFQQGIRWCRERPPREQRDLRGDLAVLLDDAERWDEAWPILSQVTTENPDDVGLQGALGALAAHRGDRGEVERIDGWLAERKGPYLKGEPTFERARIAAVLGSRERAVELYRLALDQGFGIDQGFGVHADPDFESLRDYPPFQELTRPKD
jgi:tetratricopeptide (TPR) repeat protein/TolB-like protein/predicted Ser/Thr protein kinase